MSDTPCPPKRESSTPLEISSAKRVSRMPPSASSPRPRKVNIAAINYHFRDKEGLYGAVLEEVFHLGFTRFPATMDLTADADPEQRLRAFIRAMFYRLQSREGWGGIAGRGRLIARELLDPSPAFEAVLDRYIKPHMRSAGSHHH